MCITHRIAFALGMFSLLPVTSHAAYITVTPHIPPFPPVPIAVLTCRVNRTPAGTITYTVDPMNIESFQLDVQFNPADVAFVSISGVSPYILTTTPDYSQLAAGLIQDIAGTTTVYPPPPGDVDIFTITFQDLRPDPHIVTPFLVFASTNDYMIAYDTDTTLSTVIGPESVQSCYCELPEIPAYGLVATAVVVLYGLRRRFMVRSGQGA